MAPKAKPKPSPPASKPLTPPLEDLFSALHRHCENSEYDQVLKVAHQVLSVAPGDEDAIRCKVVALIKSDAVDKALSTILASESLPIDLKFYKAYCLYRQNKLQDALESLNNLERSLMVLQLESQILYRLGKMDACTQSYEKLQKLKIDSLDVKSNFIATLVSAGRSNEVQGMLDALKVKPSNSFELAYNTACSLIENKKYAEAEQQLLSARRIGQEMLMDEDYTEEEIETELAPISVQLAYIQQLLGKKDAAVKAYIDIINRNLADASSLAIATNNLISLRGTKDASDSLRKLDRLIEKDQNSKLFKLASGLDFKLSQRQKESLYSNRLLLLLQTNKMDQAQELVSALLNMFPESLTPILLQVAMLVKEKKVSEAEEMLAQFAQKFPEKSKLIMLVRAQISAAAGHLQTAADSLSAIHDIQHMPATVATIVSLKERNNDFNGAVSVLDSAVQWWKDAMTEDNKLSVIMPEAASFKLNHGHETEAFKLYEELVQNHGNTEVLVGLVKTAARTDIAKAESYEKKLKELPGLKGINVESLEKSSGAKHFEGINVGKMEISEEVKKAKSKKRKRKPRYPKGFDPANPGPPPDPERWLPKRERSSYRPKRKDKRVQVRGSQGAVMREKHDASVSNATNASSNGPNQKSSQGSSKGTTSSDFSKPSSKSRKKNRS
ncbi:signal recognition particle subunit SRP72-like [Phalaenopsis equestris]|uniref:signal recognition particle subunit SRP72-like n=1 Tax=Phalaenopsis equestris TaxID=78828 RepID=UPI0009E5D23B|nr:signal recognition particle subunit SRP72-like [Phalaenopsis equestris]